MHEVPAVDELWKCEHALTLTLNILFTVFPKADTLTDTLRI